MGQDVHGPSCCPTQLRSPAWRAIRRTAMALALAGLLAVGIFLPRAGAFLAVKDEFTWADVAVVLSGLPISRAFAAHDLYVQGRVGEIIIIPEPPEKIEGELVKDRVKDQLVALGLFDPTLPQWSERILVALGVPRSEITVLPEPAHGTIVEAQRIRAFVERRHPHSLVIVTSKSASRRARFIFRRVLRNTDVRILAYPTPYDSFEPDAWWTRPRNALTVLTEYEKFLVNALTLAGRSP